MVSVDFSCVTLVLVAWVRSWLPSVFRSVPVFLALALSVVTLSLAVAMSVRTVEQTVLSTSLPATVADGVGVALDGEADALDDIDVVGVTAAAAFFGCTTVEHPASSRAASTAAIPTLAGCRPHTFHGPGV